MAGTQRSTPRRIYRKRARALEEAETRRRITEAVVELHRTVGPAATTVTEVAERAGVSRMTVYNHFPTESALIEACSSHWAARNPFPDPEPWVRIDDPEDRLAAALAELYEWFRKTADMMEKVLRDAPLVAPLGELMEERWWSHVGRMVDALAAGRRLRGRRARRMRAALCLVVDFSTWRTLTGTGLDDREAAELAAGLVRGAGASQAR